MHELLPEKELSLELASSPSSEMREVALRTRVGEALGGTDDIAALSHRSLLWQGADRPKFGTSQGQADG